jgi:ESCRT-II complex subunit VPS25
LNPCDFIEAAELAGIDRGVLIRAVKILEQRGKAAMFKGTSTDDDGVKFSAR